MLHSCGPGLCNCLKKKCLSGLGDGTTEVHLLAWVSMIDTQYAFVKVAEGANVASTLPDM